MISQDLQDFIGGYFKCAMWSSTDENGNALDVRLSQDDLDDATVGRMVQDCKNFYSQAGEILNKYDAESAGIDFWLTRNQHGAGFWSGGYDKPDDTTLTELAHKFGSCELYIGDDDFIHAI